MGWAGVLATSKYLQRNKARLGTNTFSGPENRNESWRCRKTWACSANHLFLCSPPPPLLLLLLLLSLSLSLLLLLALHAEGGGVVQMAQLPCAGTADANGCLGDIEALLVGRHAGANQALQLQLAAGLDVQGAVESHISLKRKKKQDKTKGKLEMIPSFRPIFFCFFKYRLLNESFENTR